MPGTCDTINWSSGRRRDKMNITLGPGETHSMSEQSWVNKVRGSFSCKLKILISTNGVDVHGKKVRSSGSMRVFCKK